MGQSFTNNHFIYEVTDLDTPADYRITVQGVIPESWQDRLGGMRIVDITPDETTLEGRMADQAALHGLFDTLYALHLPILKVNLYRQLDRQKRAPSNEGL